LPNGQEIVVKGAVLAMLVNTQAAHANGGFKIRVGFSLRKCRNCLATMDAMSARVGEGAVKAKLLKKHEPFFLLLVIVSTLVILKVCISKS